MTTLTNLQYELINPPNDDGVVFGRDTNYHVEMADFGDVDMRINDEVNPRADGIRMGRDFMNGRLITFTINIVTKDGTAHDKVAALQSAWRTSDVYGPASRLSPGNLSILKMYRHGVQKLVYGRPRRFSATTGRVDTNQWIPVTCDFQTIDHRYYDLAENANYIGLVPANLGGFIFPMEFPMMTIPITTQDDIVIVEGDDEAWIWTKITGPIVNPQIEFVNYWTVKTNITLLTGETLTIDPRPWSRGIYKNGNQNVAGCFTADSRRLSGLTAPPGVHQIVLRGTDPTGTSSMETRWRNSYSTW